MCAVPPIPFVPKVALSGLAFNQAMNPLTLFSLRRNDKSAIQGGNRFVSRCGRHCPSPRPHTALLDALCFDRDNATLSVRLGLHETARFQHLHANCLVAGLAGS